MKHIKRISETWTMLNKPIYIGKRLQENLKALSVAGVFAVLLGIALLIANLVVKQYGMAVAAGATTVFGGACTYFAHVKKRRDLAVLMPTVFCMIAFSIYTVTGVASGSAMLWTFTLPIGMCYFVSVKYGILLSVYYMAFFSILFYSPLKERVSAFYPADFINRFPIVFASTAALTIIAMVRYHRGVLLENDYADRLSAEVEKQTRVATERADRLDKLNDEMVQTLAVAIDAKDKYTNGHSFRVSWYADALARRLGWTEEECSELSREALLHDIGKIGVPDSILNKPGRLSDDEFRVIQSHARTGSDILNRSANLLKASQVARSHHERFDGKGYPDHLAGESIPLHARVVAVADAYDAMRSDRIYRKGLPLDVIREELVKGRGKQFDPRLLDKFLELFDSGALDDIARRKPLTVQS